MNDDIWIVIVLLIVIIGGSNLLMIGMVRGSRNAKFDVFKNMSKSTNPWEKEDQGFEELNKKVKNLPK